MKPWRAGSSERHHYKYYGFIYSRRREQERSRGFMFCQLNHLSDVVMFALRSAGAGKPQAQGLIPPGLSAVGPREDRRGTGWEGGSTSNETGVPGIRGDADVGAGEQQPLGQSGPPPTCCRAHCHPSRLLGWAGSQEVGRGRLREAAPQPAASSALGTASQLGPSSVPRAAPGEGRADGHQKALAQLPFFRPREGMPC